jgi:hypothetical protein
MTNRFLFTVAMAAGMCAAQTSLRLPTLGGSLGQTMRINIRGIEDPNLRCAADAGFRDLGGNPVGPARRVSPAPGQTAFLDLPLGILVMRLGQRVQLLPAVQRVTGSGPCAVSVEVFEPVSGRTLVYAASIDQPPDGLPIGGALGQTMRLSIRAVEDPDQRCAADLTVRGANGAALATVRKTLGPGQGGFLDLNFNTLVMSFGQRAVVAASAVPVSAGSADGCVASLEVFDQTTGWTTVVLPIPTSRLDSNQLANPL